MAAINLCADRLPFCLTALLRTNAVRRLRAARSSQWHLAPTRGSFPAIKFSPYLLCHPCLAPRRGVTFNRNRAGRGILESDDGLSSVIYTPILQIIIRRDSLGGRGVAGGTTTLGCICKHRKTGSTFFLQDIQDIRYPGHLSCGGRTTWWGCAACMNLFNF